MLKSGSEGERSRFHKGQVLTFDNSLPSRQQGLMRDSICATETQQREEPKAKDTSADQDHRHSKHTQDASNELGQRTHSRSQNYRAEEVERERGMSLVDGVPRLPRSEIQDVLFD